MGNRRIETLIERGPRFECIAGLPPAVENALHGPWRQPTTACWWSLNLGRSPDFHALCSLSAPATIEAGPPCFYGSKPAAGY